jgi:hypothetical protein
VAETGAMFVHLRTTGFAATRFDCIVRPGQDRRALLEAVSRFALAA